MATGWGSVASGGSGRRIWTGGSRREERGDRVGGWSASGSGATRRKKVVRWPRTGSSWGGSTLGGSALRRRQGRRCALRRWGGGKPAGGRQPEVGWRVVGRVERGCGKVGEGKGRRRNHSSGGRRGTAAAAAGGDGSASTAGRIRARMGTWECG